MALQILLAAGDEDRDRVETIGDTVSKLLGERDATVTVGHVLTEEEYERSVEAIAERIERTEQSEFAGRPETGSVNVSPKGGSALTSELEREQANLSPEEAAERVIGQKALIRDLMTALDDRGINSRVRGAIGDPAESIIEMIAELEPDFVIVGGRDRSPTRQAMFGSVSQQILREADCPIISVRSQDES